ncbi:hypothetical protein AB6M97_09605 [Streptococcus hillyeri]|uniref:Uncharacterized protein n=1 Tax=Streptococcus hillyeri TaxID=2282420 RepID=A0A3L9DQL2_9STRE|nr:hypothetical protein [Streptococcus hillyeri]RLY03611.1 hypothetical protein EAF07_04840 [Streptococcus hillyeri]
MKSKSFTLFVIFILMANVLLLFTDLTLSMKFLFGFGLGACFALAKKFQETRYGKLRQSRIIESLVIFTLMLLMNVFIPDFAWYWKVLVAGFIGGAYGCVTIAMEKRS